MEGGISSLALKIVVTMAKPTSLSNLWQGKRQKARVKKLWAILQKKGTGFVVRRQRLE